MPDTSVCVATLKIPHREGSTVTPGGLQYQMLSSVQDWDSQNSVPKVCCPVSLLGPPGTVGRFGQIR